MDCLVVHDKLGLPLFLPYQASGGFSSISDILKVPGIGSGVLDQNRVKLMCTTSQPSPRPGTSTNNIKREKSESDKPSTSTSSECSDITVLQGVSAISGGSTTTQQIPDNHRITRNNSDNIIMPPSTATTTHQRTTTTTTSVDNSLITRSRAARIKKTENNDSDEIINNVSSGGAGAAGTHTNRRYSTRLGANNTIDNDRNSNSNTISLLRTPSSSAAAAAAVAAAAASLSAENHVNTDRKTVQTKTSDESNDSLEEDRATAAPPHLKYSHLNECSNDSHTTVNDDDDEDDDIVENDENSTGNKNDDEDVEDEDDGEEDDVDMHNLLQVDLSAGHSLRSKLLMKRKSDDEALITKAVSPEKKPCFEQCQSGVSCVKPPGRISRPRIPSKNNPPSGMFDWIQTFQAWSNAERMVALDDLIEHCEPTQVRHLMAVIEPQFQRDFISLLPKELALYVLSFLEPKSLLNAAQTCQYWRILAEDNLLWREKCREERIDESLVFGNKLRRKNPASIRSPWKHLYMRQHQIEKNWRMGPIRPSKVLKGHDDHVITCLEFSGNRIVSGSDDNTLKVWSAITGKCLRTLTGHTGGVWSSQMKEHIVISGSTDRTLKIWNADTGDCLHTLYGHSSTVRCMHLHNDRVVSGSRDATLRMWNVETGECLHVYMGHVAAVRCVQYDGSRVISGAYDYMVKIWDPETETCLHTLQGHTNRVYSLQFDGSHIVSGSLDTSIRVWDVNTGNCLHTLVGHQSLTSGMELKDNILVSGNADSTVKVWDITTGQCLQTLQGPNKHQSAVTCLQFNKKFVITSSDDGTVKIWDLKNGDFIRNLVTLESGGSGGVVWRVRCCNTKLVCAVGSRNGTEETKLLVLDFDIQDEKKREASLV
ncbi:F-box/WD repeat-containing protein 7-like isoform X2 [Tubulanus polymorphus]|uniref:F-box/WD repeat-containing protein 7-like isoform X2 n=1 Tax=Tubulanus polymorphus TaxID=672921 RepID=UPI003DA600B4